MRLVMNVTTPADRSPDRVRRGYARRIATFGQKSVTYCQMGDMAMLEGDIAIGSGEEIAVMSAAAVAAETADRVRATALQPAGADFSAASGCRGFGSAGQTN